MDNPRLILLAVMIALLLLVLWRLYRSSQSARQFLDANQRAMDLNVEIIDLTREQIQLQSETNELMRELVSTLRDTR